LTWNCYLSGQISEADLEREIVADPEFAEFITRRTRMAR
jgi:hypothetical protein